MPVEAALAVLSLAGTLALAYVTLANGRSSASTTTAATLERRLAKVETDADACRKENIALQHRVTALEDSLHDEQRDSADLRRRVKALEDDLSTARSQLRRLGEYARVLRTKLAEHQIDAPPPPADLIDHL